MVSPHDNLAEVVARHDGIQLAILFGSRAAGTSGASSDLDLAVAGEQPLTAREKMALIDDLAGVFGCPVDLVDLQVVAGPILQQALSTGVVLLNKRPALYARVMLRMWYNQADMMPNYRMMLRKRVEAFTHG